MKKHSQTPRVLLAGFAPFNGESQNPSWSAVKSLHGRRILGHRIRSVELPVVFGDANAMLREAIRADKPALVICVGQAGGRSRISLERIAINVDDARIPDNAQNRPVDVPIVPDGPAAYFTSLPIKAMFQALAKAGIPAEISQTAGTFVCNHVFYGLMHELRKSAQVRGGFIHIPFSPEQATMHPGAPSLAIETVVEALEVMIRTALRQGADIKVAGGAEH